MQTKTLPANRKHIRPIRARYYSSTTELTSKVCENGSLARRFKTINDHGWWHDHIGRYFKSPEELLESLNVHNSKLSEIFENGKAEIVKHLPEPTVIKRVKQWDEMQGDSFDNDRFRSGQQPWLQTRRQRVRSTRSITLVFSMGFNAGTNSCDVVWTPIMAMAMTDLLEDAGYSVKLVCVFMERNDSEDELRSITIKDAGCPYDRTLLLNSVTGWFLRTVLFADIRNGLPLDGHACHEVSSRTEPEEIDTTLDGNCLMYEVPAVESMDMAIVYAKITLAKIEADQQN